MKLLSEVMEGSGGIRILQVAPKVPPKCSFSAERGHKQAYLL